MLCSTIIPTINRASLPRAVMSVLEQDLEPQEHEIIVVNDSGEPLPKAPWLASPLITVIDTNRRERSVARNAGAAVARGRYLHFLDDDDVLLPGALPAFWELSQRTEAAWLFGSWQTVDNDGNLLAEFRPDLHGNISALLVAGESLPLQASLLEARAFFAAGAFDPAIVGVEDRDLGRRLGLSVEIAHTPALVARIRVGERGSTTKWSTLAEQDRWGREKALGAPNAPSRLRRSAHTCYWRGRVARAYLASTVWNLRKGNALTALSRAAAGVALALPSGFRPSFWQGLRTRNP